MKYIDEKKKRKCMQAQVYERTHMRVRNKLKI